MLVWYVLGWILAKLGIYLVTVGLWSSVVGFWIGFWILVANKFCIVLKLVPYYIGFIVPWGFGFIEEFNKSRLDSCFVLGVFCTFIVANILCIVLKSSGLFSLLIVLKFSWAGC